MDDRLVKRKQKAKRDGNVVQLAQVSKELGDMYFETGRLKDALLEYNDQLMACEVLNEKLNCAIAHRMIGEAHASLGDYEEALNHQTLHLEGAREADNLLEQQRALATIGRTHFCQAQALSEGSTERKDACAAAKKAYSKSLRLCNDLENTDIQLAEMMTMRARLLLNLGLVLEEQKEIEQAVELIEKAAELFKKHRVVEDLHRTHIALGALHERQGHFGLALRHIDEAIKIDDASLRAVGQLTKAELLLRLGHWSEARQILVTLYLSKDPTGTTYQQVQRLLRIVVTICRAEESLEVENDPETRRSLYETLGDAAAAIRSYEKALEYYENMLICAEKENSIEQISASLVSLVATLRDLSRYDEALPYARRELSICREKTEICRSALNLADLMHLAGSTKDEIMKMYDIASKNARDCDDRRLELSVLNDTIIYLEEIGEFDESQEIRRKLLLLGDCGIDGVTSENESESGNIGDDICLEDLSDVEEEMRKRDETSRRNSRHDATKTTTTEMTTTAKTTKRSAHVIKRNAKGETKLHVACIAGNIDEVARLLDSKHPTNVRDYCGWTPLHEAANHGHVEIAKLLIKSGSNVDDPGGPMCGGVTPLHDAASCGHFSIISLLMINGADIKRKTRDGDTVLDCLEAWRKRSEDLTINEQADYDNLHSRLSAVLPKSNKQSPISIQQSSTKFRGSTVKKDVNDRDESSVVYNQYNQRISASEDYRRTMENLKNRHVKLGATTNVTVDTTMKKMSSPLVNSDEIIIDDWLENDIENRTTRERQRVDERSSSTGSKRKSIGTTREFDKIVKRPRIRSTDNLNINVASVSENICDGNNSDSSDVIFDTDKIDKSWKKRTKQLSLFKSGFTRDTTKSRTPSPMFDHVNEVNCNNFERINEATSETVKLQIRIGEKMINMRLRFPEQRETTIDNIMNDVVEKYENETGCRVRVTLTTMSGEILLGENNLKSVKIVDGVLRFVADIVDNEIPSIVDRYGKICKNHHIQSRDSVLRCLKICDSTSTFRVKSGQINDSEIIPLLKCLEYEEKLQILEMSGASLHETGCVLNNALKRLTTLQELHLRGCDIDDTCLSQIERLPCQLKILDLSYNPLGKRCDKMLYELLSHHRHLQTLNLRYCKLTKFFSSDEWSSLVNLDISWNSLETGVTRRFLRRQMLSLSLSNTRETENSSVAREILDVSTISLRTLENLDLSCCDLTDFDIFDISERAINLSKLNVSGNVRLTRKSVEILLVRKPSMTYIDAGGCEKIVEIPENNCRIDDPRVCTLRVSMSSDVKNFWLGLWRDSANILTLPHDIITFVPIVH